jgi:hypothetical protein
MRKILFSFLSVKDDIGQRKVLKREERTQKRKNETEKKEKNYRKKG